MCPDGHVAEWLRSGLQNRLPRFNSGRGLQTTPPPFCVQSAKSVTRLAPLAAAFKAGSALLYAGLHRAEQAIPR